MGSIVKYRLHAPVFIFLLSLCSIGACSFDYGQVENDDETRPDLTMQDLEYVRVRDGEPLVRIQAEHAERFEKAQTMRVRNLSFAQYAPQGGSEEAAGTAGMAKVDLVSGDVDLERGVSIVVHSEDLGIETSNLSWKDSSKQLVSGDGVAVLLKRSDGTILSGKGFSSDAREKTWKFSGEVSGSYIDDEEETGSSSASPAENENLP
ncbi:hypothetical protein MASR2M78_13850 [Treponema sp.]